VPETVRAARDGDTFPDQLRIRSAAYGLTMQPLAKAAGVSCFLILCVENGAHIPSPKERERLNAALDAWSQQ
jgi:hypothetical protein